MNEVDLKKKSCILQLEKKQQEREMKGKADAADPNRLQQTALALHVGQERWGQFERQLLALKSQQESHERSRMPEGY